MDHDSPITPERQQALATALAGRYTLLGRLGAGGMATVFRAHDVRHDRDVAIKVLHPDLGEQLGAARFLAEVRTTARLQHPHILPLLDSGDADGLLFFVTPLITGGALRSRLERERQLPIEVAIRLTVEVASALDAAHRQGVIHRDVKPENILLQDGHALVADFGIALAMESAGTTRLTRTGAAIGTPSYMSPEQATGDRTVDARTDVYALGALAYEMLAGEPPFTGATSQAIVARILFERPPSLRTVRDNLDPTVEAVILRALARLPADRFPSASAFAEALTAAAGRMASSGVTAAATPAEHPIPAGPSTLATARVASAEHHGVVASPSGLERITRRRTMALAGTALLVVGTAGALWFLGAGLRTGPFSDFGRVAQVTGEPGLEVLPALSPDGRQVAYAAGTAGRLAILVRPLAGGRSVNVTGDSAAVESHPQWSPDGTRLLFLSSGRIVSAPAGGGAVRQEVPARKGIVTGATWSPDGRRIAFTMGDSVMLREPDGTVRRLTTMKDPSMCRWGPNDLIACASGNTLYASWGYFFGNAAASTIVVVRAQDGRTRAVTDSVSLNHAPTWTPDGQWLLFVSSRHGPADIYAQRVSGDGTPRGTARRLTVGLQVHSITIDAAARQLLYASVSQRQNVWSLPLTGDIIPADARPQPVTTGDQAVDAIALTPDGRWLFYGADAGGTSDLYRLEIGGAGAERLTDGSAVVANPSPSPDGTSVAFHDMRQGNRDVRVLSLDGGGTTTVAATPAQEGIPEWSPDGERILFQDFGSPAAAGRVSIARRTAAGSWQVNERLIGAHFPRWAPDGKRFSFVTGPMGGDVVVAEAAGGTPRRLFDASVAGNPRGGVTSWSPDGQQVLFMTNDADGTGAIWSVPSTGGNPRRLYTLARGQGIGVIRVAPGPRPTVYFIVHEREGSLWSVALGSGAE